MTDSLKVKFKDALKKFVRLTPVHTFICMIMYTYINLAYKTSKKVFKGEYKKVREFVGSGKGALLCTWHGRILTSPAMMVDLLRNEKEKKLGVLASKHKDGQLASKTIGFFGFKEVYGSSIDKKKGSGSNKGGLSAIRTLLRELKVGRSFFIAPDGPRGPARKVGGEVVNIARLAKCPIFPIAMSSSRKIQLKTWDSFQIFLPFSTIMIEFGKPINVAKDSDIKNLNRSLARAMNKLVDKNDKILEK